MAQRTKPPQQVTEQDTLLTSTTSLLTVKTLLETGIGCVAYLRGLFVEEAFNDERLEAPRVPISSNNPPSSSQLEAAKKGSTFVKVKKLKRGFSHEADKLLDMIDIGAADALEEGYLKQLVLGIYLDPTDSSNVVECYTFTFTYEIDEDGYKHPEMIIRNKLNGMVLSNTAATSKLKGIKETSGGARRQVQLLIKNLITGTQGLNELPRRRFVNMRIYYTDDTPRDYEPPLFRPVISEDTTFQLTTSSVDDRPDVTQMGTLNTGYHGVTLHVISVVPLLEVKYDELLPLAECLSRNQLDAATRKVVWDAEHVVTKKSDELAPLGIRDDDGLLHSVDELIAGKDDAFDELKRQVGLAEGEASLIVANAAVTPWRTRETDNETLQKAITNGQLNSKDDDLVGTQLAPVVSRLRSYRATASFSGDTSEEVDEDTPSGMGDTRQALPDSILPGLETLQEEHYDQNDVEMQSSMEQVIDRFEDPAELSGTAAGNLPTSRGSLRTRTRTKQEDLGQWAATHGKKVKACECGDKSEDEAMVECTSCSIWKHVVCYGYHGPDDKRFPEGDWFCYPCRVVCSDGEALLNPAREAELMSTLETLGSLALFRRAIAVVWDEGLLEQKEFRARLAVDTNTCGQIIKRLRAENFIKDVRRPKGRGRPPKLPDQVVNKSAEQEQIKNDVYFNPDHGAELGLTSLLGLSDMDAEGEEDIMTRQNTLVAASVLVKPPPAARKVGIPSLPDINLPRSSTTKEDPIEDSEDETCEPPLLTPEDIARTMRESAARRPKKNATLPSSPAVSLPAPHAPKASLPVASSPRAVYVPNFNKAKGKAPPAVQISPDFHRASSSGGAPATEASQSMVTDPEPDTQDSDTGGNPHKRNSQEQRCNPQEAVDLGIEEPPNKRKRCSEADELEV